MNGVNFETDAAEIETEEMLLLCGRQQIVRTDNRSFPDAPGVPGVKE